MINKRKEIDHNDYFGRLLYECKDEEISRQIESIKNKYSEVSSGYLGYLDIYPSMSGAYIKDDYTFIPVNLKMDVYMEYTKNTHTDHKVIKTESFYINNTSLNAEELEKQGYRYINIYTDRYDVKNYNAFICVCFPMDSGTEKLFKDALNNDLESTFDTISYRREDEAIVETLEGVQKYRVFSVISGSFLDSIADDHYFTSNNENDLTNRQVLKREYIIAVVIIFVLLFIVLYLRYSKRMRHYEMNTYRRELTNVLAHDIKTPLMAIRGNAENLQDLHRQDEEDEDKLYVDGIVRNVDYVDSLVNKTLSLSSLESGFEMLNKENVSVKDILDSVLARDKELLDKRGIKIDISGEDITVSADEFWFGEALENLLSNAAKYADENSTVNIEIKKRSLRVINSISDMVSGDGSPDAKKLSNPFYKNDRSRSGRGGSGIGLSIVKNIIEMHGWRFKTKVRDGKFIAEIVM
ncbi:MAG: HAMP domain-containing histidine kinase [Eubacterium sp.]|nr:HAMP domain-containing histidine kinase [Eubacterium sp.]